MRAKDRLYARLPEEGQHLVELSSLVIEEFLQVAGPMLGERPLVLLRHCFEMASGDPNTGLAYVEHQGRAELLEEDVFVWGPFFWVDAEGVDSLRTLPPEQVAELLYLAHTARPLRGAEVPGLGNLFCYLGVDDGMWLRLFCRDRGVMRELLSRLFAARSGVARGPDGSVLDQLCEELRKGLLFDTRGEDRDIGEADVPFVELGRIADPGTIPWDMDGLAGHGEVRRLVATEEGWRFEERQL